MQVAQGEGANKKCQLLYYPGGHCVPTLSPGAGIWLSLTLSPCVLFTFLISYYLLIPIKPQRVKENL